MVREHNKAIIYEPSPKVMPPTLFCGPTSEVDVGGMTKEVEPSQKLSITFFCCVTDDSKETV